MFLNMKDQDPVPGFAGNIVYEYCVCCLHMWIPYKTTPRRCIF